MNRCQQCRATSDCPAGQTCNAGRCEAAPIARNECTDDATCGAGRACQAGRCVTAAAPAGDVVARSTDGGACEFPAPHFGFDDATLSSGDRDALQRTAE